MRPGALTFVRWGRAVLLLGLVATLLSGCGDERLWARYRAERDLWQGSRWMARIERAPARVAALQSRARAPLEQVVRQFPVAQWIGTGSPYGDDVAAISGRAANALARLERLAGRPDQAAARYARVMSECRSILPVAIEAAHGRAEAIELGSDPLAAARAWESLGADYPFLDPKRGTPLVPVLDAPPHAARLFDQAADSGAANRTLRAAVVRYAGLRPQWSGSVAAPEMWVRLAVLHDALGEPRQALDAFRSALDEPHLGDYKDRVLLGLAEQSLRGGRPDSALVYATWAEHDLAETSRGRAIFLSASAWEAAGNSDSALAAYQRYLDGTSLSPDSTALAHFRRADLLERTGDWEQARSEFHALAAQFPDRASGFEALLRIVRHHAALGEQELANLEARRALETVEQVIASYQDSTVLRLARQAAGELRRQLGRTEAAPAPERLGTGN